MIKLDKLDKPQILVDHADTWRDEILAKLANGEELTKTDKSRYSHPTIKEALKVETAGKCAYCESEVLHITFGDIEHICPKSENPELWVEWLNLTLACTVCNNNKRNYNVTPDNFIDPYTIDPEKCFWFSGPIIIPFAGNDAALLAERRLKLNRGPLIEKRIEKIKILKKHIELIARETNPESKEVFKQDLHTEMEKDKEYSALARGFIAAASQAMPDLEVG